MKAPAQKAAAPQAVDPVTVELVRNGVMAATGDMTLGLMRAATSAAVYEAMDFAAGLFTAEGETVSLGIGLPMLMRSMAEAVKAKIRHFGADGLRPGDIYITNDPGITGTHLNHVVLTQPVFLKDALTGFACCMARWLEIGGVQGGMTADIFAEGLQLPILKYQDRGKVNRDLIDIIRQNVRGPDRALGDLRAQATALAAGERRFLELITRHGREPVAGAIAAIMDRSEKMARARTQAMPDGVYEAESFLDDDGVTVGRSIPVRVRVVVKGDEMTVDLTDVSRQVRGFYNAGAAIGHACAQVAYKCLTSSADDPVNDGAFRSLKTIVPPGRVVSAARPAPMRSWMTFPMTVVDTILKALAPAIPDRVIAGHHADLLIAQFHGFNPKASEFFAGNFGPLGGGWGAKQSGDGVSAAVAINGGDARNMPSEQIEAKFPLVIERYALVPDSGGAGRCRGGLGVERVVRARTDITLGAQVERAHCRPWGLAGGRDGRANAVALRVKTEWKTEFPTTKALTAQIKAGDAFRLRSGGGGGYGPPLERPVKDVCNDVRQGYVSVHDAAVFYGVVIYPDTFRVNEPATLLIRGTTMPALPPPSREEL
jgi:N-methylhydantoinase B